MGSEWKRFRRAADRLAIALKSLTESKENRNSDLTPLAAKAEKGEGDGGAGSGRPAPKGEIMAETSISALRLVSLLEKIRGGLRRFWGTVRSTPASGGSHFPFYWSEWDSKDITTAADYLRDLDLAPDAERLLAEWSQWENLCDDLLRTIEALRVLDAEEGSATKHCDWMAEQFCVFPDNIDPNDLSEVNRLQVIVKHITHLSVLVDELIATVKAKFPSLTLPTLDGAEGQKSSEGNGGAVYGGKPGHLAGTESAHNDNRAPGAAGCGS